MSHRRDFQDAADRLILKTLLKGRIHWSDLYRLVMASCQPYATPSRFNGRMKYLLRKGYIQRVEKGVYQITESGRKYLEII